MHVNRNIVLSFLMFFTAMFMSACLQSETREAIEKRTPECESIEMTISSVEETATGFLAPCGSSGYLTIVRSKDGRTDFMCGKWGKPGDKITGYWHTGNKSTDRNSNGFSRFK